MASAELGEANKLNLPDLEAVLREAPADVSYEPDNNGFDLRNRATLLRYTVITLLSSNNVYLLFLETSPKVKITGRVIDMRNISNSLVCDDLTLYDADGNPYGVARNPYCPETPIGPEEWFQRGDRLLKIAAQKYRLMDWCEVYNGRIQKPELSDSKGIRKFLQKFR